MRSQTSGNAESIDIINLWFHTVVNHRRYFPSKPYGISDPGCLRPVEPHTPWSLSYHLSQTRPPGASRRKTHASQTDGISEPVWLQAHVVIHAFDSQTSQCLKTQCCLRPVGSQVRMISSHMVPQRLVVSNHMVTLTHGVSFP